jgi:hypothetical protein
MRCTFDQKEYCPLEHDSKGNTKWQLYSASSFDYRLYRMNSNQKSGKNYVGLTGAFRKATIKTPLISNKVVKGLCLSFNYLISNYSVLLVNKVNNDGRVKNLFEKEENYFGEYFSKNFK